MLVVVEPVANNKSIWDIKPHPSDSYFHLRSFRFPEKGHNFNRGGSPGLEVRGEPGQGQAGVNDFLDYQLVKLLHVF